MQNLSVARSLLEVLRTLLLGVLVLVACGDDDGSDPGDAAAEVDTAVHCTQDDDCSDGLFCTGIERCDPDDADADSDGCVPGIEPCEGTCEEDAQACEDDCADEDGDGAADSSCGGQDCDDSDPNRYPGNSEICDVDNVDEDCDPRTVGFRDADMDGVNDALCCNGDTCGGDCNDMSSAVHNAAPEVCDNLDNDCDGQIDEMVQLSWYPDNDMDGFGDADASPTVACAPPLLHVLDNTDCNDGDRAINPVAFDVCDGTIDHNCNGTVDDPPLGCACVADETRSCDLPGVCAAAQQQCISGTWSDCSVSPSPEECDGQDDDCDGTTDESLPLFQVYRDVDGDGFGDPSTAAQACSLEAGFVLDGRDCYDVAGAGLGASPLMNEFSMTDRGDGSFDFNCDSVEEQELGRGSCQRVAHNVCSHTPGWAGGAMPACGVAGPFVMGCQLMADKGGNICEDLIMQRVARCR